MIIIPKTIAFDATPSQGPLPDASRRNRLRIESETHDRSTSGSDKKRIDAKTSTPSLTQSALLNGLRQVKREEKIDPFNGQKTIQIKGISNKKTIFNKHDLANIKKDFFRLKNPLVLVQQASSNQPTARYLHGPEQLKSLGSNLLETLAGQEIYIFMGSEAERFIIPRNLLKHEISGPEFLEAILGSGDNIAFEEQPGANRCLLAALLQSGTLGTKNIKMASLFYNSVPDDTRHDALTSALYNCIGSGLSEIGQALLDWGADPNGTRSSDDFGILQHAVITKDTILIKLLIHHGADPSRETETCISSLDYADLPDFSDMKPHLIELGKIIF